MCASQLFFQLASTDQRIGTMLMRSGSAREQEAACFYFERAVRKLRQAGVTEKAERMTELRSLHAKAEAQLTAEQVPQPQPSQLSAPPAADASDGSCVLQ